MEGSCAERGRVAPEPQAERAHGAQVCRMPTVTQGSDSLQKLIVESGCALRRSTESGTTGALYRSLQALVSQGFRLERREPFFVQRLQ